MSKTVGFEKEEKHVFDSTESQKENKENIDSKEINIQEKLGKLKNLRGQNKKKRKSIFGSFKKSIALQELEYNRLKTTYEKGSYKYNIQYESD